MWKIWFYDDKILLDNGFDGNRKNSAGRTILQDTVLLGNDKVFQILFLNYDLDFDIKITMEEM